MQQVSHPNQRQRRLVGGLVTAVVTIAVIMAFASSGYLGLLAQEGSTEGALATTAFDTPTTSSPIAMSQDKSTIWVVNPDDGSVSVLGNLDSTPSFLTTVKNVGEEPQAIALDTGVGVAQRAYVVSPPDNRVTILKVSSLNPFTVVVEKRITTGAEECGGFAGWRTCLCRQQCAGYDYDHPHRQPEHCRQCQPAQQRL